MTLDPSRSTNSSGRSGLLTTKASGSIPEAFVFERMKRKNSESVPDRRTSMVRLGARS
jgi:hypothetical protein